MSTGPRVLENQERDFDLVGIGRYPVLSYKFCHSPIVPLLQPLHVIHTPAYYSDKDLWRFQNSRYSNCKYSILRLESSGHAITAPKGVPSRLVNCKSATIKLTTILVFACSILLKNNLKDKTMVRNQTRLTRSLQLLHLR